MLSGFVLRWGCGAGGGAQWLTTVILAAGKAWRSPSHREICLVSLGLPKCLDPPFFLLKLQYYSVLLRQRREGESCKEGFLLSCISSCNLTRPPPLWACFSTLPFPSFALQLPSPLYLSHSTTHPGGWPERRFLSLCYIRLGEALYSN